MKFPARVEQQADGRYMATSLREPYCVSDGMSFMDAVTNLRDEIRYRLETCPCGTVTDSFVEVDVVA